jgi:hypothetical protein
MSISLVSSIFQLSLTMQKSLQHTTKKDEAIKDHLALTPALELSPL